MGAEAAQLLVLLPLLLLPASMLLRFQGGELRGDAAAEFKQEHVLQPSEASEFWCPLQI